MTKVTVYRHKIHPGELKPPYTKENFDQVRRFHRGLSAYAPSPMVSLSTLAEKLGLGGIYVKDESKRFGLNAFKGLGASFAVHHVLQEDPSIETVVTATDGNHGKAVAWAANQSERNAVIFMPKGTAPARSKAIEEIGDTKVFVTDSNYADSVRMATKYAEDNKATLVQDTAFEGYRDVPEKIVLGYSTMAAEAAEQLEKEGKRPTHVFLQAGVGSMAAGNLAYLAYRYKDSLPTFIIVEAEETACLFKSIKQGKFVAIGGHSDTKMAGLNCGEPNPDILPLLDEFAEFYVKCADEITFDGMRQLAHPLGEDKKIVSGECGGVGTGLIMALMTEQALSHQKKEMGLKEDSVVLLFSTEGDTDPEHYEAIVSSR